ncbi:MAG: hypothetical protein R3C68_14895 [Myxococcota bacterium]
MVEEHWSLLRAPGLDNPVGVLATELYRVARDQFMLPAKDLGLKKKDFVDVRASDLLFVNLIRHASKLLNMPGVDFYRKGGSMEALHMLPIRSHLSSSWVRTMSLYEKHRKRGWLYFRWGAISPTADPKPFGSGVCGGGVSRPDFGPVFGL